jgi:hypothetical protein
MAEKLFYYLLALSVAGGIFLVYGIVLTELRSRRECRERERLRAAYSEIQRLQASNSREQQDSVEEAGCDSPEAVDAVTLDVIKQVRTELNQRVMDLERRTLIGVMISVTFSSRNQSVFCGLFSPPSR